MIGAYTYQWTSQPVAPPGTDFTAANSFLLFLLAIVAFVFILRCIDRQVIFMRRGFRGPRLTLPLGCFGVIAVALVIRVVLDDAIPEMRKPGRSMDIGMKVAIVAALFSIKNFFAPLVVAATVLFSGYQTWAEGTPVLIAPYENAVRQLLEFYVDPLMLDIYIYASLLYFFVSTLITREADIEEVG